MKNKIVIVVVLGLIVRIVLALATFHSDIQPFFFAGQVIIKGNILNFYDYLWDLPNDAPILNIYPPYLFNYPPAVYFFLGPVTYLLTLPFNHTLLNDFIFNLPHQLGNLQLNFLLLILKLPYLPFDLASGFLLSRFFKNSREGFLAFCLWIFNPFNLYTTYMIGTYDVIPTFFTILAIYLAAKKINISKSSLATEVIILGLGAAFKIYPLLFVFPLVILKERWLDRIKLVLVAFLTYGIFILPFINSVGFRSTALLAGQTMKSLYAKIDVSGGESIMLFPLVLIIFYIFIYYSKSEAVELWQKFFIILLIFFAFTHYHPQWFLWITPFLIIDLVKTNFKHFLLVLMATVSFVGLLPFFDAGLTLGLFSPIYKSLYGLQSVWSLLRIQPDLFLFRSLLQTLFAAVGFYYIFFYFLKKKL